MLSSQAIVEKVLTLLKQKIDPNHVRNLARWTRQEILDRCNLMQDEMALELPGLFDGNDSSLVTIAGQMEYTLPAGIGMIREVAVNGIQLVQATKTAIQGDSIRGDLVDATEFVQDWTSITDQPYLWYQDNMKSILGLYPKPVTAGQTISIDGELLIALLADSGSSYPLNNLNALRKAQIILIYKVAEMCASEDAQYYGNFLTWVSAKIEDLMRALTTYWAVLRPSPAESTMREKETEGATTQTLHHNIGRP